MNLRLTLAPMTLALTCLSSLPAFATEPEATYQEMVKCSVVAEGPARLACYDALMPRVRAALAAGPEQLSHEDQTTLFGLDISGLFGSSEATTPQQFGADNLPHTPAPAGIQPIESITATLTDYAMTPLGKFIVFLDNGQVWRQQQADTGNAHFHTKPGDNKVLISRGALGSYDLSINGSNKQFKVNRVK